MARAFEVKVDPTRMLAAGQALVDFAGGSVSEEAQRAVNEQTAAFMVEARRAMIAGIMLSEGYVSSKMQFDPSTNPNRIRASITTAGDLVILGHYNPVVQTVAAKRPNRAKGDKSRGVPPGQKAAGVGVTIKRGQPKTHPEAFTMRLRRGTDQGDSIGVFTRRGDKKLHRYGIAPYSLFRFQVDQRQDEFAESLSQVVIDRIVDRYGKEIPK